MEKKPEPLRERLLAQFEPEGGKLAIYRKEVQAMLEKNERTLRRQKWYAGVIWVFVVAVGTCFLFLGGQRGDTPVGAWLGILACFFLIGPAVEIVKYFINRSRVEVLKELKGLELQLLEIKEYLQQRQA
jgi:purine-cytosine permease-like protein